MEAANLPTFLKFGNTKKSDICVIFAKNHGWPRNWEGGWSKTGGGLCPSRPKPKTTTYITRKSVTQVSLSILVARCNSVTSRSSRARKNICLKKSTNFQL